VPLQAYAVLIIDEAQNLASQLLEEIRILSDLEGPEKLLQLVLVGQPELREKLKDPTMRQVDQRISVRCSLQPLERDALNGYIAHRLTVAGGGSDRVEFTPEALDLVYSASSGNPRVLNLIADKSLHRGHLDRTWIITPAIVTAALGDLGYARPALTLDMSFPVAPPVPAPTTSFLPGLKDQGPLLSLDEAAAPAPVAAPVAYARRGRRRLRRAALLATAGLALAAGGVAVNEWELRRQELAQPLLLPAVTAPPPQPVSAGAAPVVPPAEFFSPVIP
jgi:hypothetical protein